jgi:hypothetical protein
MIFRKALLANDLDPDDYKADILIGRFRKGELSGTEFGFAMRLWGNYNNAYNPVDYILDNANTFKLYKTWFENGRLTGEEYGYIYRYYFNGLNMILSQERWEEILVQAGCDFTCHPLQGKDWYRYYCIYSCRFK